MTIERQAPYSPQAFPPWNTHVVDQVVTKVEWDEDKIINERLSESLLNNSARDFWSEIKHVRSSMTGNSCSVDGHTEAIIVWPNCLPINTATCILASHTKSMKCSIHTMKSIVYLQMNRRVLIVFSTFMMYEMHCCLSKHIRKMAALVWLATIINANDECICTSRNCARQFFLYRTLVASPKGKYGNVSDSSDFRGITLSSIHGKLLDNSVFWIHYLNLRS